MHVTGDITLDESELQWNFVRARGPGGQHVNKAATAVQLRFDASRSEALTPEIKERLRRLAGRKMSEEGVVTIEAGRFRSQKQNREDALTRLLTLIRQAAVEPKERRATKPSAASRKRRLEDKRRRSETKRQRGAVKDSEIG
jgi:ribosome-associated protein